MKSGDRTTIPTVAEVVRDATALCDPAATQTAVTALYEGFEDDDRPATAAEDLAGELLETVYAVDPEGDEPAALAAVAAAAWLAANPDQLDAGDHVIREGVRLVFEAAPPEPLAEWLDERGVDV